MLQSSQEVIPPGACTRVGVEEGALDRLEMDADRIKDMNMDYVKYVTEGLN